MLRGRGDTVVTDGKDAGLVARWSRRKLARQARRREDAPAEPAAAAETENEFLGFDFDSLNFLSDYTRFMAAGVPDQVRNKALQKLWVSTDIIAEPDELDEFREDFRDKAKAVPAALARSGYRIGRGFIDDEVTDEAPPAQDAGADERDGSQADIACDEDGPDKRGETAQAEREPDSVRDADKS